MNKKFKLNEAIFLATFPARYNVYTAVTYSPELRL
jgi:hypothetical protein